MCSTPEVACVCTSCVGSRQRRALLDILYCSHEIHILCVLIDTLRTSDVMHSHGKALCEEPR